MIKKLALLTIGLVFLCMMLFATKYKNQVAFDYSQYLATGNELPSFVQKSKEVQNLHFLRLDYTGENRIVFHNTAYLFTMKKQDKNWTIESMVDLKALECWHIQGSIITQVNVLQSKNLITIQNHDMDAIFSLSPTPLYEYNIEKQQILKYENAISLPHVEELFYWLKQSLVEKDVYQKFKILYKGKGTYWIALLDNDGNITKEIESVGNTTYEAFFGYVDRTTLVQIALATDVKKNNTYRLVFYNIQNGETWEQLVTEGF